MQERLAVGRPPGYPAEFERRLTLRDGRAVDVRPILPTDAAELGEAIRAADADTLYRRFLGGPPPVTPGVLAYLTVLDYRNRFALVARDPATGRGVAVARYDHVGGGAADIAIAVDPGWRRAGLATALVHLLGEAALDRGISTFTAVALANNRPVAALVAEAGGASFVADGIAELQVALAGPTGPGPAPARPRRRSPDQSQAPRRRTWRRRRSRLRAVQTLRCRAGGGRPRPLGVAGRGLRVPRSERSRKTPTVRMPSRRPTAGRAWIMGVPAADAEAAHRHVGYLPGDIAATQKS